MIALIQFFQFSGEQRRFILRKKLSDTRTPEKWLELLHPLAAIESGERTNVILSVLGFAGGGFLAISGVFSLVGHGGMGRGLILLVCGSGLLAVTTASRLFRFQGEHLGPVLNPLLAVLREDVKPGDAVTLELDLRSPERRENCLAERQLPPYANYTKVLVTTFSHSWLKADGILADGTRLRWEITDFVQRTKRTKQNSRKKTSWKVKHRVKTHLKLHVGLRQDRFELRELVVPNATCERDEKRLWIKLRRTYRDEPAGRFDAAAFVRLVMDTYARTRQVGGEA